MRGDPQILRGPELPHIGVKNIEGSRTFIDSERIRSATTKAFHNFNPADTRAAVGQFQASFAADARAAVRSAAKD